MLLFFKVCLASPSPAAVRAVAMVERGVCHPACEVGNPQREGVGTACCSTRKGLRVQAAGLRGGWKKGGVVKDCGDCRRD